MPTRKPLYIDSLFGNPNEFAATDTIATGSFTALGVNGVGFNAGGFLVTNVADPVNATDAVNKRYVDASTQGISVCDSVRAYASGNIANLTGLMTIDGVSLVDGDHVLLNGQTNSVQNGFWVVHTGSWTRPSKDFASGTHANGKFGFVQSGTNFSKEGFICNSIAPTDVVDTHGLTFTQFSGLGDVTAGAGLITSGANGNAIAVQLATNPGLTFTANALDTLLNPAGALKKDASGIGIAVNSNNTVAIDAQGLRTLGVPQAFTVAGNATSNNVSAANLSTLVDGSTSIADSLHTHQSVYEAQAVVATGKAGSSGFSAGDPVMYSSTADTLVRCDAGTGTTTSQVIGVALNTVAANGVGKIVKRGIAKGVLSQATPGSEIFLGIGGGLTSTVNTASGSVVIRVGYATNATDLDVQIQYKTVRS